MGVVLVIKIAEMNAQILVRPPQDLVVHMALVVILDHLGTHFRLLDSLSVSLTGNGIHVRTATVARVTTASPISNVSNQRTERLREEKA